MYRIPFFILILLSTKFSKIEAKFERIITNLEEIYGKQGVQIGFSYNETKTLSNQFISVPGCPKSIDGIPWVYYGEPRRCYLALGDQGPCPSEQKFLIRKGSVYVSCVCECVVDEIRMGRIKRDTLERSRYVECFCGGGGGYGKVFDTKTNACYEIATQGPCPKGKLLVNSTPDSLRCLPACGKENWPKVMDGKICRPFDGRGCGNGASTIAENKCPPGEKYSEKLKLCAEDYKFELA